MRACAAVIAAVAAALVLAPAAGTEPSQSQSFFRKALLEDAKTSAGVKRLLRTNAGIVDPRSGFVDVTGDERADALVFVTTNGAAGSVALYVFSTHGQDAGGDLKVVFRSQSLHRATLKLAGTRFTIVEPRYAAGDDLCCPGRARQRDYTWQDSRKAFARTDDRLVEIG